MMIHMHVPKYLWADAVLSVCHLINRMPSSVLHGKISFSSLYPHRSVFPITSRVFDCTCFVQDLSPSLDKLSPRSIKCVYSRTQDMCYNQFTRKYFVFADVSFFESVSYFSPDYPVTFSPSVPLPSPVPLSAPVPTLDVSSPVSQTDTVEPSTLKHLRVVTQQYTRRPKVPALN